MAPPSLGSSIITSSRNQQSIPAGEPDSMCSNKRRRISANDLVSGKIASHIYQEALVEHHLRAIAQISPARVNNNTHGNVATSIQKLSNTETQASPSILTGQVQASLHGFGEHRRAHQSHARHHCRSYLTGRNAQGQRLQGQEDKRDDQHETLDLSTAAREFAAVAASTLTFQPQKRSG